MNMIGLGFHSKVGTISASFGVYSLWQQCGSLHGFLATLYTFGDIRMWSSTTIPAKDIYSPKAAYSYGDKGGVDLMYAIGEPDGEAKTMGSQRPALL